MRLHLPIVTPKGLNLATPADPMEMPSRGWPAPFRGGSTGRRQTEGPAAHQLTAAGPAWRIGPAASPLPRFML